MKNTKKAKKFLFMRDKCISYGIMTIFIINRWVDRNVQLLILSNNLPKIYQIYIAGDVKEKTFGNIKYIHKNNLQTFIDNNEFHTVIVHRYACFFNMFENTKCYKLLLSLHDTHILSTKMM